MVTSSQSIFGWALGRALAKQRGLSSVVLPQGLHPSVSSSLVERFNSLVPSQDGYPVAIRLVEQMPTSAGVGGNVDVDVNRMMELRFGNRLVVSDQSSEVTIETISSTFAPVIRPNFPDMTAGALSATSDITFRSIADAIVAELQNNVLTGAQFSPLDLDRLRISLEFILRYLASAYAATRSESSIWQRAWFAHVDMALTSLVLASEAGSGLDFRSSIDWMFAAFSMPQPNSGSSYKSPHDERKFLEVIEERWSTEEDVQTSLARLEIVAPGSSLDGLNWASMSEATFQNHRHSIFRFAAQDRGNARYLELFGTLSEARFFDEIPQSAECLEVLDMSSEDPKELAATFGSSDVYLLGLTVDESGRAVTALTAVDVQMLGHLGNPAEMLTETGITLGVGGKPEAKFTCVERLVMPNQRLRLIGMFTVATADSVLTLKPSTRRVKVDLTAGDPIAQFVSKGASTKVLFVPVGCGNMVAQVVIGSRSKTPELLPPYKLGLASERFNLIAPEDGEQSISVPPDASVRVISLGALPEGACVAETMAAQVKNAPRPLNVAWVNPSDAGGSISIGEVVYSVTAEGGKAREVFSPIIAALVGERPSLDELPSTTLNSLRGAVERQYRDLALGSNDQQDSLIESLGHVFLPSDDQSADVERLAASPCGRFLTPASLSERWGALGAPKIPSELLESPEFESFQSALRALRLGSLLTFDRGAAKDDACVIPSQARLTDRESDLAPRIESYLDAYVNLLETAKLQAGADPDQPGVFWAAMPFAVSVWSDHRCQAVMLSPLHPIRLAWLSGVESTLRRASATLRKSLSGIIEGWNLPFVGPTNSPGKLIAVPSDNGPGEIFVGWSLLARASIDGPTVLSVPEFAGSMRMPGTATSGISRGGVSRAIRDYRAVFPHVSTLSVDLASTAKAPRLPEIDAALIEEAQRKGKNGQELPGGIRVFDSLNRTGPLPDLTGLQQRSALNSVTPLVWSRYSPSGRGAGPEVDIRIIQDQGARVLIREVTDGQSTPPAGMIGPLGLRRMEVRSTADGGPHSAASVPGLGPESSSLMATAIRSFERTSTGKDLQVCVDVAPDFFGGHDTRWSVSGETAIRPGSIPKLLPQGGDERMLWEWRPSFLDGPNEQGQLLERRPYVSFTKVSMILVDQIARLLQTIEEYPVGDPVSSARQVITTLGIRGVGLSRLLAGKDERAIGAIGFALALELAATSTPPLDAEGEPSGWDFVFPIDMCEQYLRALAGEASSDFPRKADLLLLRLSRGGRLQLAPIEIKVRHLETTVREFPQSDDSVLLDAAAQAFQTHELLSQIATRFRRPEEENEATDRDLMASALGALIEACISLRMEPVEDLAKLRSALASLSLGEGDLDVGRPVVLYLGNGGSAGEEKSVLRTEHTSTGKDQMPPTAQFLVNAGALASELWAAASPRRIVQAWSSLVEWVFADPSILPDDPVTETQTEAAVQSEREPTAARDNGLNPTSATEQHGIADGGVRFEIGSLLGTSKGTPVEYWPSNTALNQMNIGVVGDLGTGKTELVKALVLRIRESAARQGHPVSFLILDYKGDYKEEAFLSRVGGRLVGGVPIPLDLFDLGQRYDSTIAWRKARQFVDVIRRIWKGVGAVQSERLETAVTQLFHERSGVAPTLQEVSDRYRDLAQNADSVTNVLSVLTRGGWFSSDRSSLKSFTSLIGDDVLVVSMDDPDMDDQTKNTIAALFLNLYRQHMFGQKRWPFEGSTPQLRHLNSFILIDEAHNLMSHNFTAMSEILLQGRQFGVGVILSSQFLTHFKTTDTDYREPLLTWFIHKVPSMRPQELRELGMDDVEALAAEVPRLGTSQSVYKSLGVSGRVIHETPYWKIVAEERAYP